MTEDSGRTKSNNPDIINISKADVSKVFPSKEFLDPEECVMPIDYFDLTVDLPPPGDPAYGPRQKDTYISALELIQIMTGRIKRGQP